MITNADTIKQAINMEELVVILGHQVNRKGRCTCPIHGGTDANFSVKDGIGTCFSQCGGKTWTVTDLIMEVKQFTYPEALEWLANQSGIQPEYQGTGDRKEIIEAAKAEKAEKTRLYEINEAALTRWENGREVSYTERYDFDGRDWGGETVKAFRIVLSPDANALAKSNLNAEELKAVGLIVHSAEKDVWYDALRARIIFPYFTHQGNVAGFSGRKLASGHAEAAKYKNSSESLIFKKRELLFGLWQNRRTIHENEAGAVMMEGMADVVTSYDYGIRYAVASGGTAITREQLQLLKRYTKKVTFLMDGDEAGHEAAKSGVEEAIAQGFRSFVVFFPEPTEEVKAKGIKRYDPDNFLRLHGKDAFETILAETSQDGLLWRVMLEWHKSDIYKQAACVGMAARFISQLDNEMARDYYSREFITPKYFGKDFKNHLSDALKEEQDKRLKDNNKPDLTPAQQADIKRYGLYVKNNQYWVSGDEEAAGYPVSNFAVHPVMLVVGSAKSERRVEIRNVFGAKFTANIDSDSFVEMTAFRKEVERRGNFLFLEHFRPEHFTKMKRKLYEDMKVCYPITTLGRHQKLDFFAWANGIVTKERFVPIDEHGIVAFKDAKFFLPAMAADADEILSDDQDNSYEDQKHFVYIDEIKAPALGEWGSKMADVHGAKGMMAVAWYLAALYRDLIYDKMEFFPHLNAFGPPGTGKSFLGWSLSYMFGKARRPYNLHDGTNVGFFRRMAQVRNGVAWYDEYNNNVDVRRAQGLKNAYDGAGREKGVASTDNRTVITAVNSALLITGQEMPTQDIALYTRCITLSFPDTQRSEIQNRKGNELMALQQTGCLSQITTYLQKYREYIADNYDATYDDVRTELTSMVKGRDVLDRLINNYSIPLAIAYLIGGKEDIGFKFADLLEFAYKNLLWQSDSIGQEDDLAVWWDTMLYYIELKELRADDDYIVQHLESITVKKAGGKETETFEIQFEAKKKVLFLTFTKAYRFYREQLRKEGNNASLNQEAIKYYLRSSPAFLGDVRAKKFNGAAKRCFAFDMAKLKFDLECDTEPVPF